MPKFRVVGMVPVTVTTVIEAETPEEAMSKAEDCWGGLTGYCGNGGRGDKLCGPHDYNTDTIEETGDQPEWESASEIGEDEDE